MISSKLLINLALLDHVRSLLQLVTQMQWMWIVPELVLQPQKITNPEDTERSGLNLKDRVHEEEEGLL